MAGKKLTSASIIPRSEHLISRANISENALKVLYRLKDAGFQAYLVGGGVRDLMLGREPKDFDVSTDAHPDEVRGLFRNCRLIGRRFRLAHVHFQREIIEVSTFRAHYSEGDESEGATEEGRILRDNVYGTVEEDAWRRDFTVNALYYNIADFSVGDYTGGVEDLKSGLLRLIGDPEQRYREDPVRMLRGVRFEAKLGLRIESETEAAIFKLGHLLEDIPPARLFEEVLKLFHGGCALQTFEQLRHYRLFGYLFPATETCLEQESEGFPQTLHIHALKNTDLRIAEGKPVTPAFVFAALLWAPVLEMFEKLRADDVPEIQAMQIAGQEVIRRQVQCVSIPRRFSMAAREIWTMQLRLLRYHGKRAYRLIEHPRFRAAYDFMVLRAAAGEDVKQTADWWTTFQETDPAGQSLMLKASGNKGGGRQRRPRRRKPAGSE